MAEKISVQSVTDIITSKAGREYFTFEDISQKRYVCFIVKLKEFCKVGSEIEADLTLGKSADDSPRLDMIYVDGKPVISVEKKTAGRSYGKSDKELTQIRQLAEAQNRSIQAQTALNRAVELTICFLNNKLIDAAQDAIKAIDYRTKGFYQLLQSLTLISEAEVIDKKIEEVKGEAPKIQIDKTATTSSQAQVDDEVGADETRPKTVPEFLAWLKDHNIKAPRTWLEVEWGIGSKEILTMERCQELFKQIQEKEGW